MPCHITDGPSDPEDADDRWRDRELEDRIAEDQAREEAISAVCVVCHKNYVDVLAGEDTCPDCALPF